jgi:hypothetical protein
MILVKKPNYKSIDRRKTTTTTGIPKRGATFDHDSIDRAQSAPSSPALSHFARTRSTHNRTLMNQNDVVRIDKYDYRF